MKEFYVVSDTMAKIGSNFQLHAFLDSLGYGAVFEDDGQTGYFYALDTEGVLDALHIYNVDDISDREIPYEIKILADEKFTIFVLSVNNSIQAVFDFEKCLGKCSSAFPPPFFKWKEQTDRALSDQFIKEISGRKKLLKGKYQNPFG